MKTFGKAVIGTMLAGAALNGTANAHDGNHERTIYSTKVKGKCEQALSQSAPAPQVVIYPTTTYVPPVTTMVPTTRYETITENVCTPVTRVVPTTTYAPSTNTGYYSSTPTHTTSSYTTSDGPCNNADTGEVVPCPSESNYTTGTPYNNDTITGGTIYTPHTSGTYTGESYPSGSITEGTNYQGGTITDGTTYTPQASGTYTGQTHSSVTPGYYPSNTGEVLAGASPLITGGSSMLDSISSSDGTQSQIDSILNYGSTYSRDLDTLSPGVRGAIIGGQTNTPGININQIRIDGRTPAGVRTTTRGSIRSGNYSSRTTYRGR